MTERKGPGWEELQGRYNKVLRTEIEELLKLQDAYWKELLDASERIRTAESNRLGERITELETALQEKDLVLSSSLEPYDEGYKDGAKDGYDEGYKDGYDAGCDSARFINLNE